MTSKAHRPRRSIPINITQANEHDALRSVLLNAGVSLDLVAQVLASNRPPAASGVAAPEIVAVGRQPTPRPETRVFKGEITPWFDKSSARSPFDIVLETIVKAKSEESVLFGQAMGIDGMMIQTPDTASFCTLDLVRFQQIVTFTFGEYFTECITSCNDSDVFVRVIEMAERYIPTVTRACETAEAFEGYVALLRLALAHTSEARGFQVCCHLACTIFQAGYRSEPSSEQLVNFMNDLPRDEWTQGLATVLQAFLENPQCWMATTCVFSRSFRESVKQVKSVNRYFLRWIRLLQRQEPTQFTVLALCVQFPHHKINDRVDKAKYSVDIAIMTNRLRLIRLLITPNDEYAAVRPDTRLRLRAFCHDLMHTKLLDASQNTARRLAREILEQLDTKKKQIGVKAPRPRESEPHTPIFMKSPPNSNKDLEFATAFRRYVETRSRPHGLYHHRFELLDPEDIITSGDAEPRTFRKGNIQFHGIIQSREPVDSYHPGSSSPEKSVGPFHFDWKETVTSDPSRDHTSRYGPTAVATVVSPFAVFRGTVERRGVVTETNLSHERGIEHISPANTQQTEVAYDGKVSSVSITHLPRLPVELPALQPATTDLPRPKKPSTARAIDVPVPELQAPPPPRTAPVDPPEKECSIQ